MRIAWRAFWAVLSLPVIVAVIVPAIVVTVGGRSAPAGVYWIGLLPAACGILICASCVRVFATAGHGTLAPWDPPTRCVVDGLYRWVRNPMYIGVLLILAGAAIGWRSMALAVYAGFVALAFHLRVVMAEEPRLRARFGEEFEVYARHVNRWVPRLTPFLQIPKEGK
jgi:protein-S-isoprenylcysteine O-methyltransferase Ste14